MQIASWNVNSVRTRLDQVLANLVSNAMKFSPSPGEVRLEAGVEGAEVVLAVHDDGPGIPDDFRDRVYSRFSQADGTDARAHGGSGLGLSIVRSIVQRHGGRIWFRCPEGGGTSFFVALPAA